MKGYTLAGDRGSLDDASDIERAIRLSEAGDFEGAAAAFRQAARDSDPAVRGTSLWQWGRMLLENMGKPSDAVQVLKEAWALRQPLVAALAAIDLAKAYESLKAREQARELYEWVWKLGDDRYSPYAAAQLARFYVASGDAASLHRALAYAAERGSGYVVGLAHRGLGNIAQSEGNLRQAEDEFTAALAAGVDQVAEVRAALARVQAKRGDAVGACGNYETALAEGVTHPASVHLALANLRLSLGDERRALKNYVAAWKATDQDLLADVRPSAAAAAARLYRKTKQVALAKAAIEYAVANGNDQAAARALCVRGAIDQDRGDLAAARSAFSEALRRVGQKEELPEALLAMARIDAAEGNLEAALERYQSMSSAKEPLVRASAAFGRGTVLARLEKVEAAVAAFGEAVRDAPTAEFRRRADQRIRELSAADAAEKLRTGGISIDRDDEPHTG